MEEQIEAIILSGNDVIASGAKFGDLALHYINKYKMMAIHVNSKRDVWRLCKAVEATALITLVIIAFLQFAVYALCVMNLVGLVWNLSY